MIPLNKGHVLVGFPNAAALAEAFITTALQVPTLIQPGIPIIGAALANIALMAITRTGLFSSLPAITLSANGNTITTSYAKAGNFFSLFHLLPNRWDIDVTQISPLADLRFPGVPFPLWEQQIAFV